MKIKKEILQDILFNDEYISNEMYASTRWSGCYTMTFKHEDGKIYEVDYTKGLTELQDEKPFSGYREEDEIEVHEVEPVEVVSVKYIRKDRDIREPV